MRLFRTMGSFGERAAQASSKVRVLDDSLAATGSTATKTATSVDRAARATNLSGTAATKAATAQDRHATALRRVDATMGLLAGSTEREQAAVLRALAAQERYDQLLAAGTADTRALASAQASLVSAQRSVAAAQAAATKETAALATAQTDAAVSGGRLRTSTAGLLGTAKELGLLFGAIEIGRKAIEFIGAGKDLTDSLNMVQAAARASDAEMVAVRAQAIALGKDLTVPAATAVDAADAILELVKAGIALPRAIEAARPALLLAAATNSKMADTAKVLGDTMDIFSIKGGGAAHAANIIGASVLGASHDLLGFFDAMKQAGPTAQALGLSIDDVSTAIVYLAKHGLSQSMGGAAIKTFLSNLTKDVPKATAALKDLGVEAFDSQGRFVGFPKIFDQLHAAYIRFGPDSQRFLKDLNAAFGVRSQSAAALFGKTTGKALDEVRRHLQAGDLQKFADTMNRGVGASLRQLGKEATAAGIDVYQKLEPHLATAVTWLGTSLPHALGDLRNILSPTISLLGGGLTLAWRGLTTILSAAAAALSTIDHLLSSNKVLLTTVTTAVVGMWAAFKLAALVRAGMQGLSGALDTVRLRAMYAGDAARNTAANLRGLNGLAGLSTLAMGGLAAGLAILGYAWSQNAQSAAKNKAQIDALTSAIESDNGALGENTRKTIENQLASENLYQIGLKAGISQKTLTDAVLGNAAAIRQVNAATKEYGKRGDDPFGYQKLRNYVGQYQGQLKSAIQTEKDKTAADGKSTTEIGRNTTATSANTLSQKEAKAAAEARVAAVDALNTALQNLAQTELAQIQSEDAFKEGLLGIRAAVKENGTAVDTNTKKGLANRDMLAQLFGQAVTLAQAQRKNGDSIGFVTNRLSENVRQIIATATAAGISKPKIDALVRALNLTPRDIRTTFHVDTSAADRNVRNLANMLAALHDKTITVTEYNANRLAAKGYAAASGGTVPGAPSRVDSVPAMLAPGEEVITAFQADKHRPLLKAINAGTQGFAAGGTVGRPVTRAYASATRPYAMQTAVSVADITRALNGCRLVLDLPGVGKMNAHIDSRASSIARAEIDGDRTHRTTLDGMRG